jgi:hypothetical protein|tara:strand:- start:258 stop:623 length:366 start_codon:yes stop_codon:yes gene_type:complete
VLNWLRKKALESTQREYSKGLSRTLNFSRYVSKNWVKLKHNGLSLGDHALGNDIMKNWKKDSNDLMNFTQQLERDINELRKQGYSEENMNRLLDLDMMCRRFWGISLGESDLKFNKSFNPE